MKKTLIALGVCSSILLASCASMFGDANPHVQINTFPTEADLVITNVNTKEVVFKGKTPALVKLPTSDGYFEKAKYSLSFTDKQGNNRVYSLRPTVHGAYWLNLIMGGLLGMLIIDPLTGAMYTLPNTVRYDLTASNGFSNVEIKTIDELSAAERGKLIPVPAELVKQ